MNIDEFYLNGEINWLLVLKHIEESDSIAKKAEVLTCLVQHEANKKAEGFYVRGWNSCESTLKKVKRFSTRHIKDAILEDDFAVVTVREFVRWYASVMDEIKVINENAENECCREVAALLGDKMDNSLKGISTDRRLLFSRVLEVLNAEDKKYEREE